MISFVRSLLLTILLSFGFVNMVYAVEADMFLVEVTPDTFQAGQAVDLKISVMLDDGSIVKDYDGDVFITVNHPDDTQYTVPSEGIYTFVAENQ